MVRCFYKEEKHILDRQTFIQASNGSWDYRSKALLSLDYLTASRVSEICLVTRYDIRVFLDKDRIKIRLKTKKRRGSHKNEWRYLSIPISTTQPFSGHIINYLKTLPNTPTVRLFPGKRSCEIIIKKMTGHGSHCVRHTRLNHLAENGFNQFDLQAYVNWAKPDMALEYVRTSGQQIEKKLREAAI